MVYIIQDSESEFTVLVVKAVSESKLAEIVKLKATEKVIGKLSENELAVLYSSDFVVIEA